MAKVLVTGGAGFIGSSVARKCVRNGHEVVILDNLSSSSTKVLEHLESLGAIVVIGDIRDPDIVQRAMRGCDAVIHLAAQISVPASVENPQENYSINVEGTQLILNYCKQFDVRRVVIASSAAVYGREGRLPLREESAGDLLSPYAQSKWNNEQQIIASRLNGQNAVALRIFNVYGPGQRADGGYAAVIPKFIDMMVNGEAPIINGDGLHTRDFVHVNDVCSAIFALIEGEWQAGKYHVYNIATQTKISLLDLIEAINNTLIKTQNGFVPIVPTHGPERVGDIRHSMANIERIQTTLGWKPVVVFEDGIEEIVRERLSLK
tara:strand:- start:43 stop:1002 length:960 start_codon:yes stop_codon:yes gene_type:complete